MSQDRSSARVSDSRGFNQPRPPSRLTTSIAALNSVNTLAGHDPNPVLTMVLALAWDDIPVFPVWSIAADQSCGCGAPDCRNAGKHPLGRLAPKGFHDATCDLYQVVSWWDRDPIPNVGICTGT